MHRPRDPKRPARRRAVQTRSARPTHSPLVELIESRVLLAAQPIEIGPAGILDPNDEISESRVVSNNSSLPNEVLTSDTDVNMYRMTVSEGQTIAFDTDPDAFADTVLRLFRSNGTELDNNDDGAAPGEPEPFPFGPNYGSFIEYTFSFSGTVYIGVSCAGNVSYDPVTGFNDGDGFDPGGYALVIGPGGGGGPDADDQISEARPAAVGGSVSDVISQTGDVDMFAVTVTAGQVVAFDTDSSDAPPLDTILRIFRADGTQIAFNDDGAGPDEGPPPGNVGSFIRHTFVTGGTYYVGVSGYDNAGYNAVTGTGDASSDTGSYILFISGVVVQPSTIGGTLWDDADGNRAKDAGEAVLPNWTVYLDQNNNGSFDAGEPTQTTDAGGSYTFTGLTPGQYTVRQVVRNGWEQTYPGQAPQSEFSIEVNFIDGSLTPSQQAAFTTAARRWSQVIVGDLPDAFGVDDLRIDASAPYIDGPNNVLGQAGPTASRGDSMLPYRGMMQFDSADIAALESSGQLVDVILHEMGHVLGIGTIWSDLGLIIGEGGGNPVFSGVQTLLEYNAIFGGLALDTPVENQGGSGTRDGHWRESVFDDELMTGFLNSPGPNPLSRITAASLADLGYVVNMDAADPYVRPGGAPPAVAVAAAASTKYVTGRIVALDDLPRTFAPPAAYAAGIAGPAAVAGPAATVGHIVTITSGQAISGRGFGSRRTQAAATVAGRHVFYNNSSFDGRSAAANGSDDAAIATDKQALLPGQLATFANYTSYSRGINGVMIDVAGLPSGAEGSLTAADFVARAGTDDNLFGWQGVTSPTGINVRRGAGVNGSDRVTLTWAEGAVRGKWLEVNVQANERTGLGTTDTFYIGNLPGETGNSLTDVATTAVDYVTTRNTRVAAGAGVDNRFDFNRDGRVNVLDLHYGRAYFGRFITLLSAPFAPPAGGTFGDAIIAPPPGDSLATRRVWDEAAAIVL